MIEYVHDACGKPAFYYDHMPATGDRVEAKHATLLDGTKPEHGAAIACGSCGQPLPPRPLTIANLRESEAA